MLAERSQLNTAAGLAPVAFVHYASIGT